MFSFLIIRCGSGQKNNSGAESDQEQSSPLVIGDTAKKIDAYLTGLQEDKNFSGGLLIIRNGEKILCKGYGLANREKQIPFTENTLASMGSITKAFTAAAIMKLAEQGKLNVNDSLKKFFNTVPADKAAVTIHQLLTHSSGFHEFLEDDKGDYEILPRDSFLARAFKEPLGFTPGSKAVYTNVGMSVLAAIIEKVSGKSYETFLKDELFSPVGISGIGYHYPANDDSLIAHGYDNGKDWGTIQRHFAKAGGGPYWNLLGNGGLEASLNDMYTWITAIDQSKILKKETVEKMFTPHIVEDNTNGRFFFGYGCNTFKSKRGTKAIDNGGSNRIYFARMLRLPEEGITFYLVTNEKIINANDVLPNVTQLYFEGKISHDALQMKTRFESQQAETTYKLIIEKGSDNFLKNYKSELKSAGISLNDDMMLLDVGEHLLDEKKADEAVALYKVYTKEFPKIIVAWNDLGDAYLLKNDKVNAKKCFQQALKLRPENERAKESLKGL